MTLGRRLAVMAASALATLAVAVLVFMAWGVWTFNAPGPAAPHGKDTTVILRHGASVTEIASDLEDKGVVRSGSIFMAASQITGATRQLKAGEYAIPSHASLGQILDMIRHGRIVRHLVTIPEGTTSEQVVAILMANPVLTGSVSVPEEGSLLPETYEVVRGDDRAAVLQRMIDAHDKLLAELWPHRQAGLPFETPEQAVILASIVEKETGLPGERPRVAAVFVNRLKQGIRLASDPTIIYGLTRGVPLGHGIRQSELAAQTPYNTYQIPGLTPTPICNPGRAAIAATLDPAHTGDLYFVANGTGGHAFASTLADHDRNVERWRQIEAQRAAKAAPPSAPPAVAAKAAEPLRGKVDGR